MERRSRRPIIIRALEFFSGIGGFSAAVRGTNVKVVAAFDQSPLSEATYRINFPNHPVFKENLEHISIQKISSLKADFWWLSPPCQPYTVRGKMRDENDPRAASLKRLVEVVKALNDDELPMDLALENVEGFARSQMRQRFVDCLERRGFEVRECVLCPTMLGVPMRRPRYYLLATRGSLRNLFFPPERNLRPIASYLEEVSLLEELGELLVPPEVVKKFGVGFHIIDPNGEGAYATCFTAAYGRAYMRSGSYLKAQEGVRFFSPREILRLMGFPETFAFPSSLNLRQRWRLIGNSLSVTAVTYLLQAFPNIVELRDGLMIISGGQTGADRAALDFAMERGWPHGGWVPRGRLAEDGPLNSRYQVWETKEAAYTVRTEKNVLEGDGTLIISHGPLTGGSSYTRLCAIRYGKPWLHVDLGKTSSLAEVAPLILRWIKDNAIVVLNVAGPRATTDPSIYEAVLDLLRVTFKRD